MNRIRFFVHNDPDAVRIELAGSFRAADVETIHHVWQRAGLIDAVKPVIVDISFVTDADEHARALLVAMHRFGTWILANSPASSAIARPIVTEPIKSPDSKESLLRRLVMPLVKNRTAGATHSAVADVLNPASAQRPYARVEYTGFGDLGGLETAMR